MQGKSVFERRGAMIFGIPKNLDQDEKTQLYLASYTLLYPVGNRDSVYEGVIPLSSDICRARCSLDYIQNNLQKYLDISIDDNKSNPLLTGQHIKCLFFEDIPIAIISKSYPEKLLTLQFDEAGTQKEFLKKFCAEKILDVKIKREKLKRKLQSLDKKIEEMEEYLS